MAGDRQPEELSDKDAMALIERTTDRLLAVAVKQIDFASPIRQAAELERQAAVQLRNWVAVAKSLGASWTEIGKWLGVSKQAAQQRYGNVISS